MCYKEAKLNLLEPSKSSLSFQLLLKFYSQCERRGRSCEYSFKSEKRGPKRKLIANGAPDNFSLPEEEVIPEKKTKRENKKKEEEKLTISKLQPDNSWAHVYQRSVAPFSSSEHGSFSSYQIQRILQIDNEKLKNASIDSLTDALEQLTIVSHGKFFFFPMNLVIYHLI